jgi:demethylmenaquinone methyltransferase/2-methoxy-6-polyprenyl-1,4-benzoquinol methylase
MKVLETAPERYDKGLRLLTAGRWEQVCRDIAAGVRAGDRVLDVGCGTGLLAVMMARRGAHVTGIDISPPMLSQAAARVSESGFIDQIELREIGAVDMDTAFQDGSFDAVVSTLVFSELSDDEIGYALSEIGRILRPGGKLFIADEVLPDGALGRLGTFLLRLPFVVVAFVLTQNTTRRVAGLDERIAEGGFRMLAVRGYLAGTLRLFVAQKEA